MGPITDSLHKPDTPASPPTDKRIGSRLRAWNQNGATINATSNKRALPSSARALPTTCAKTADSHKPVAPASTPTDKRIVSHLPEWKRNSGMTKASSNTKGPWQKLRISSGQSSALTGSPLLAAQVATPVHTRQSPTQIAAQPMAEMVVIVFIGQRYCDPREALARPVQPAVSRGIIPLEQQYSSTDTGATRFHGRSVSEKRTAGQANQGPLGETEQVESPFKQVESPFIRLFLPGRSGGGRVAAEPPQ